MWKDLSMTEKGQLMDVFLKYNIRDIDEMRSIYDDGGYLENPDDPPVNMDSLVVATNKKPANFINRLQDPNRKTIPAWDRPGTIVTHKMAYATDDRGAIVFPLVQEINGELKDFTNPRYREENALKSAINNGDTVRMTPREADTFTRRYKEYYPFNMYAMGGQLPDWDPEHVHYHDEKGNKIDITAVANDPNMAKYKAMADAHYKEMENSPDRFTLNPAYQKAYNALRFAAGQHNRSPFVDYNNLPEGLSKGTSHAKGTILYDKQGNNYIPSYMADEYTTVLNTPTYSVPYTDNKGNVTYYQAKMPQQYFEKPPLPIDYTITQDIVDKAKQRVNEQYIKDNTETVYEMSLFDSPYSTWHTDGYHSFENLGYSPDKVYADTAYTGDDHENAFSIGTVNNGEFKETSTNESVYRKSIEDIMNKISKRHRWGKSYNGDDHNYIIKNSIPILQLTAEELTRDKEFYHDLKNKDNRNLLDFIFSESKLHPVKYTPSKKEAEKNSIFELIPGLDYGN